MSNNYIPDSLGPFQEFTTNFVTIASDDPEALGLTMAGVATLSSSFANFLAKRRTYNDAKSTLDGLATAQNEARDATIVLLREAAQTVQNRKATTDEQRRQLRLPIRKEGQTPIPPPATLPSLRVEVERGGRHEIIFSDDAIPNSDRKPSDVMGCEIHEWVLSPGQSAPDDYASWPLVGIDTHNPYLRMHPPKDAGKEVVYVGRWLNAKGEPGPWGQPTAPQTIAR